MAGNNPDRFDETARWFSPCTFFCWGLATVFITAAFLGLYPVPAADLLPRGRGLEIALSFWALGLKGVIGVSGPDGAPWLRPLFLIFCGVLVYLACDARRCPRIATLATLLALLAISLRIPFGPVLAGYLFHACLVAVCQWDPDRSPRLRPVLCAAIMGLWAFTHDSWLLGCLYLVAVGAQEAAAGRRARLADCALALAGAGAGWWIGGHTPGPWLQRPLSPWALEFLEGPGGAGAFPAYPALAVLGLAGLHSATGARGGWGWLALLVFTLYQARSIPFFAIAAAPFMVAGLAGLFRSPEGHGATRRLLSVAVDTGIGLACLLIPLVAWPGWWQLPPFGARVARVEWSPSLKAVAEFLRERQTPGEAVLVWSEDACGQLEAMGYSGALVVDAGLAGDLVESGALSAPVAGRLDGLNIGRLVFRDENEARALNALGHLMVPDAGLALEHQAGNCLVFRRQKVTGEPWPVKAWRAEAFGPSNPCPDLNTPGGGEFWKRMFLLGVPSAGIERQGAEICLALAEVMRFQRSEARRMESHAVMGARQVAGWSFNALGPWSPPFASANWVEGGYGGGFGDDLAFRKVDLLGNDTEPGLLALAMRQAHMALVKDPEDARSWLLLGESCLRLSRGTAERSAAGNYPEIRRLRQGQAVEAFNRGVRIDPENPAGHAALVLAYQELGYLDLALEHALKATRGGRTAQIDALATEVGMRKVRFENESKGLRVVDRAVLARDLGLARLAREVLEASDISAFGRQGQAVQVELHLMTGRAADVAEWIDETWRGELGPQTYHTIRYRALMATRRPNAALAEMLELASRHSGDGVTDPRALLCLATGTMILDSLADTGRVPVQSWRLHPRFDGMNRLRLVWNDIVQRSDAYALAGVAALEAGRIDQALLAFRSGLGLAPGETLELGGAGSSRDLARHYARLAEAGPGRDRR